jgi:hypothetical protein
MMLPIQIRVAPKLIYRFTTLALLAFLGLSRDGMAQQDYVTIPDDGFAATAPQGMPSGLHFGTEEGPTGGPYQPSEFFEGVTSSTSNDSIPRVDNVFGLCFNLSHCVPSYASFLIPGQYAFSWTWEGGFEPVGSPYPYIENNVDIFYSDGTIHRPWALIDLTGAKAAGLNFSSTPNQVNFQINTNGNVVIGPPFQAPTHQLEVVGSALVTKNIDVSGNLTVAGQQVVTGSGSASYGPLQWGISDGAQFNSASAVCAASRLGCQGAVLPNGTQLTCVQPQPLGVVFFALCQ